MSTPTYYRLDEQRQRRELWFETTRQSIHKMLNEDGSPAIPQFDAPHRETLWIAPALYTGSQKYVDIINRAIERWNTVPQLPYSPGIRERHGSEYGIFQTNTMTPLYHHFHELMTPKAKETMMIQVHHATRTYRGSGQPDVKFQGANDNMPMMATTGLIFAGEILDNKDALAQGIWNLNQARLLLSRSAWMSEFNSSTYSPVTLGNVAKLATFSRTPEVRELALEIEHRLWAELLLHFHPPTFMQAGPQCRAYSVDYAGHTHALQLLFWLVFGPELSGRDPIRSYFQPDGREALHFDGCTYQSIAEFTHFVDTEFHLPVDLAELVRKRNYPAKLRGRAETLFTHDSSGSVYHTETYMEEEFSLGTCNIPMGGGEQSATFYATYKRNPVVKDFRDASSVYFKYVTDNAKYGQMSRSQDGGFEGEIFVDNKGWSRALQKNNVGLLAITPNLNNSPLETDTLRLDLIFPAHYGGITRTIIGDGTAQAGAVGESAEVVPVSVEAGEVFVHFQPLIPTSLPRRAALRFSNHGDRYQVLELINYEGPKRTFTRKELELAMNGIVMTIDAKRKYGSLEEFHRAKSKTLLTDYFMGVRFIQFQREDAWLDLIYGPRTGTAMTEAVDGRTVSHPYYESNQIDVTKLPFLTGPVKPNNPIFPWKDSLEVCWYPEAPWMIGARGLPGEKPYSHRVEQLKA